MKLWLKASLICGAVLLVVVVACSTMLLLTAKETMLDSSAENVKAEQSNLQESFRKMVALYGGGDLGRIERQSLVKYCFQYISDGNSALVSGDETVYSSVDFDPQVLLPLNQPGVQTDGLWNVNGNDVLIVGSSLTVLSEQFTIYVVRDVTKTYHDITKLMWRFGFISAAFVVAGVLLVIILIRYATQPLKELGRSVKHIARGEYAERVDVGSRDEVGDLAADFNTMAGAVQRHVEELKEVNERQQLFIGGLTHEFKTPLTSVIGHAETLLYTKMPDDVVERSLLTIHDQCRWLERLTQKLLRLITLQEEISLREEPVEPLLEALGDSVREAFQKRGVLLEISCATGTLPMDSDLMLSLLVNLAENASKASANGQTVRVRAYDCTIEVSDEGIGIPGEELARVTEPFYMVDKSRSKSLGGVGLGLALVKKIADAHGAQLAIASASGQGTTVSVVFPR